MRLEEKQRAVRRMREQEAELAAQVPTFFSGGKVCMISGLYFVPSGGEDY